MVACKATTVGELTATGTLSTHLPIVSTDSHLFKNPIPNLKALSIDLEHPLSADFATTQLTSCHA